MDDQLDNDLKNRIREVFDDHEDNTADEGWLLLREKFPVQEKQRRTVYLWWGGVAAALLLFLGIGLWVVSNKQNNGQVLSVKPVKPQHLQSAAVDSNNNALQAQTPTPAANNAAVSQPGVTNPVNTGVAKPNTIAGTKPSPKPALNQPAVTPQAQGLQLPATQNAPLLNIPSNTVVPPANYAGTNKPQVQQPANNNLVKNILPLTKADSNKNIVPKTQVQQFAVTNPALQPGNTTQNNGVTTSGNTIMTPVKVKPKVNSMEALLASEAPELKKMDKATDRKVRFGVYAATFFNYAKGSQNQVNAGAGFTSDISLSKNLKLSTGLALAQNTLNYDKSTPSNGKAAVSFSPSLATAYNSVSDFSKVSSSPSVKNYNASLIGLDVPVNLKYEFNPQKSDTYISAGLSSGTFINEAYTASYSYPALAMAAGVQQQTTDETTRKSFNSFYFAKTLNLSFGVGYPLGKTNRIVIEPFFKYPLDGLGSQQIKFGAGGINLKLNFKTTKK